MRDFLEDLDAGDWFLTVMIAVTLVGSIVEQL